MNVVKSHVTKKYEKKSVANVLVSYGCHKSQQFVLSVVSQQLRYYRIVLNIVSVGKKLKKIVSRHEKNSVERVVVCEGRIEFMLYYLGI